MAEHISIPYPTRALLLEGGMAAAKLTAALREASRPHAQSAEPPPRRGTTEH